MALVSQDFIIAVNEDWRGQLTLQPAAALTVSAVALMQVRPAPGHPDVLLSLSSIGINAADVAVTFDTTAKTFAWVIAAAAMRDVPAGGFAYDVLIKYATGQVERVAAGKLVAVSGVTRTTDLPTYALREDGGFALREDGGFELRE